MKHIVNILLVWCACFAVAVAQNNQISPPRFIMEEIRYDAFPHNSIDIFLFDLVHYNETLCDHIALFQNDQRLYYSYKPKMTPIPPDSMRVLVMVDSRIPQIHRNPLLETLQAFSSTMPEGLSIQIQEVSDISELGSREYPYDPCEKQYQLNLLILNDCFSYSADLLGLFGRETDFNVFYGMLYTQNDPVCRWMADPLIQNDTVPVLFSEHIMTNHVVHYVNLAINALQKARYTLSFTKPDIAQLDYAYEYTLSYSNPNRQDTACINFTYRYPEHLIERGYLEYVLLTSDSLKECHAFDEAHALLKYAYVALSKDTLKTTARKLIKKEAGLLLESEQAIPGGLFKKAEDIWGYDTETTQWYRDIKTNLLKHVYDSQGELLSRGEQLTLLTDIFALDSADTRFTFYYYHALGDSYLGVQDYANAVKAYLKVYDNAGRGTTLGDSLYEALGYFFQERFIEEDFQAIHRVGLHSLDLIEEDFPLSYYFGYSSQRVQDFPQAYISFRYLYLNWQENNGLVEWNELLSYIEELAMKARDFEQALYMNIRLQRSNGGNEHIRNYLMNLRTADYYWIATQKAVFFNRNSGRYDFSIMDHAYPGTVHPAINAVYLLDPLGNVLHTAYARNDIRPPDVLLASVKPEVLLREWIEMDVYTYIIQRVADSQFLVLELASYSFEDTEVLLYDVKHRNMLASPWEKLRKSERHYNQKRSAIAFVTLQELELKHRSDISLLDYWQEGSENIEYMLLHKPDGEVWQSYGFEQDKAVYAPDLWERSSVARAYFEQVITYNGHAVRDIALPVNAGDDLYGVIRIGFRK